ncbi:MAG: FdhF/YdeP family oxidoreductase [Actinomycetota bacterium]
MSDDTTREDPRSGAVADGHGDRPPVDAGSPRVGAPKAWASGLPAVVSTAKHVVRDSGPIRGVRALKLLNQPDGFDCPSCAWPDPDGHRSFAEFCENGAKAAASEAMPQTIGAEFFAAHSVADLAAQTDYWHDRQGRLAEPMLLDAGDDHYRPVTWNDAFELIAAELHQLSDPNDAIFYTSGRTSNEAAFLYQLFVRHLGTNNLPDCSNMCHESSGAALGAAIGIGKGTVSLDDIHAADTIICVGQNPGTNHPRMLAALETAVQRGATIVAINPLKEAGLLGFAHPQRPRGLLGRTTDLAGQYLQPRVNGDMALFRGVAKAIIERGAVDEDFVAEHTRGIEDYHALVASTDWGVVETMSGVQRAEIERLADTLMRGERRLVTCWAMGLTQHRNAVDTIREVVNVHLLLGAIGRPGAGLCPVRGHSNVQGDRTMGIFERMPADFHDRLDEVFDFRSPRAPGHDTADAIVAMHDEPGKVFIALGGNFAQASPDTDFTARALRNCALTVHVSTKLNRSHLVHGQRALILPCLGRSEIDERRAGPQFVTTENSMGIVERSQGRLAPPSPHLRSEVSIVAGIAAATVGDTSTIQWQRLADDYSRIRDLVERVVPGFDDYDRRASADGGFSLPNGAKERIWNTSTGRAGFGVAPLSVFEPTDPHRLVLQTSRSHDQFNTTIYGLDDRYRGVRGHRRVIYLNAADMAARGIKAMDTVDITSYWSGDDGVVEERTAARFVAVPYDMPASTAMAYFPEANSLVPIGSTAEVSGTPTSKSVEIDVARSTP